MLDVTALFCDIDDFWQDFEPLWKQTLLAQGKKEPRREQGLCPSEIITIIILFHIIGYRNFKSFYLNHALNYLKSEFPEMPSYNRFVELKKTIVLPLFCYLHTKMGCSTGISFVDSASLAVCHPKRIHSHKVFKGIAKRGKTSVGWFYGFKLHIVINDCGELLAIMISPGNCDDRKPVPELTKNILGKLFGDKGYISMELFHTLLSKGVRLITKLTKKMKNKLMPMFDKILLRKRGIIESVIDQLKNISQIEHTRHRSPVNFLVNLFAGLVAYCHREKKPRLCYAEQELKLLEIR